MSDVWISLSMKQTGNFQTAQALQRWMCDKRPEKQTASRTSPSAAWPQGLKLSGFPLSSSESRASSAQRTRIQSLAEALEDVAPVAASTCSPSVLNQRGWLAKEAWVNHFAMQIIKSFIFSFV